MNIFNDAPRTMEEVAVIAKANYEAKEARRKTTREFQDSAAFAGLHDAILADEASKAASNVPTSFFDPYGELQDPFASAPPGLLGEVARFVYDQSPRQIPAISTAAALGLMAGIAGRAFNVNGLGLNLYIALVAETGIGKDAINSGLNKLIEAVASTPAKTGVFSAMKPDGAEPWASFHNLRGPSRFASRAAIGAHLQQTPCSLSIIGEFGHFLARLQSPRAPANDVELQAGLLEVYGQSGAGGVWSSTAHSDKANDKKAVWSPAISIIGEGTPGKFYEALTEAAVDTGLVSRFLIIEYSGAKPYLNGTCGNATPSDRLIERLCALYNYAVALQAAGVNGKRHCALAFEAYAEQYIKQADNEATDLYNYLIRDQDKRTAAILWSRTVANAYKLAAISSLSRYMSRDGVTYTDSNWWLKAGAPTISIHDVQWALSVAVSQTKKLIKRFAKGDVGSNVTGTNDDKQLNQLRRSIRNLAVKHKRHVITYREIQNNCGNTSPFKNDRYGATAAIKRCLTTLCDMNMLRFGKDDKHGNAYTIIDGDFFNEAPSA